MDNEAHKQFMVENGFRFDEVRRYWLKGVMTLNDEAAKWFFHQKGESCE